MKYVKLIHNPTAGEAEHSKKKLIAEIEKAGYTCSYSSTKEKDWETIEEKTDIIVLAGGDGTVRKSVAELLSRKVIDKKFPLALLPYGTANNIAKALELPDDTSKIIPLWDKGSTRSFDVGKIHDLKDADFFLESFGFGVFPELIKTMRKLDDDADTPEENIMRALKEMDKIIKSFPALHSRLILDGVEHEGNFILCEIMNTRSLGPNLILAPDADPGDGVFDIVLLTEANRDQLREYVKKKIAGEEVTGQFEIKRANKISIIREETLFHADDELIETNKLKEIKIELYPSAIDFLV